MEVNLYRYIGDYGDGILIILSDEHPTDIVGFSIDEWQYLGKYDLPEELLKTLGWNGKDDHIKVYYME